MQIRWKPTRLKRRFRLKQWDTCWENKNTYLSTTKMRQSSVEFSPQIQLGKEWIEKAAGLLVKLHSECKVYLVSEQNDRKLNFE